MKCPRCEGRLETYRLDGREASVCVGCGCVDSVVRHEGQVRRTESWDDAIDRFMQRLDGDVDNPVRFPEDA